MMKKSEVTIFGEESKAHVVEYGTMYAVIRDCDKKILAMSGGFEQYLGNEAFTKKKDNGDIVLVTDTPKGEVEFYIFHNY